VSPAILASACGNGRGCPTEGTIREC
jgi:hypothetical protein